MTSRIRTRHSLPESAVRAIAGGEVIRAILYQRGNGGTRQGRNGCDIFAVMEGSPMERKKASEYPQELLNLFDQYVHGDISRREFLDGSKKVAVGGLTAADIFE